SAGCCSSNSWKSSLAEASLQVNPCDSSMERQVPRQVAFEETTRTRRARSQAGGAGAEPAGGSVASSRDPPPPVDRRVLCSPLSRVTVGDSRKLLSAVIRASGVG